MVWYDGLFQQLEAMRDEMQSRKMSAYMQNKFQFLGIPKPKLDFAVKPFLKEGKKANFTWDFVFLCWSKPYREAQYVALSYVPFGQKSFVKEDLEKVKSLICEKSWWDTVDSLDAVCGTLVQKYPELKATMLEWSSSDNLWLRRTAIDFQQRYKEATDCGLLELIIVNNLDSREFFINKAIGWSLREYSKVNPQWVKDFIEQNKTRLNALSVREAGKLL